MEAFTGKNQVFVIGPMTNKQVILGLPKVLEGLGPVTLMEY